ncbi:MAG: transposase [Ktedonobacteraceae bacterium]|nr:transposase [Ktedonobacteraceae bacterium]
MSLKYATTRTKQQEIQEKSKEISKVLEGYLHGLLEPLDAYVDKRLVETFLQGIRTILEARNQAPGLTISELGSILLSGRQATAGEKRIDRLISSKKWSEEIIKMFQWNEATKKYEELRRKGEEVYAIWDGSEIEKPESQKAEDLCAVRSSKAARRKKARKGAWNQPGGRPIVVLGYEWTACVVVGKQGKPSLAMMEFWSRKGPEATTQKKVEERMIEKMAWRWGKNVLHLFDRGYAGGTWLEMMRKYGLRFLIRWKKGHHFLTGEGEEKALGRIGQYKKSWGHRTIWDERGKRWRETGIVAVPVRHASYAGDLWVVIVRRGGEPWYLITNQRVETEEQAWECYQAYCRRWQVETVFRYEKCELGIETIRSWKRERRDKLLHMVSLVHSFLLHLLSEDRKELVDWILHEYCQRKGKKQKEAKVPIYRLRWALSRFFREIRPIFAFSENVRTSTASHQGSYTCSQNSG